MTYYSFHYLISILKIMCENNTKAYQLSIQMSSIQLSHEIAKNNDTIRVSITTLPDEQKQAFHVKAKELYCFNHSFNVNITRETEKIIVVFRKKDFLGIDEIVASTVIRSNQLPKIPENQSSLEMPIISKVNTINVYEPIQNTKQKKHQTHNNDLYQHISDYSMNSRKVLGNIQIQFILKDCSSFATDYENKQYNNNYNYKNSMLYNNYNNNQENYRNATLEIY